MLCILLYIYICVIYILYIIIVFYDIYTGKVLYIYLTGGATATRNTRACCVIKPKVTRWRRPLYIRVAPKCPSEKVMPGVGRGRGDDGGGGSRCGRGEET